VPNLGTVLAGPDGRTVYLFEKDQGPQSSCAGACAQAWPPLTTSGSPPRAGAGVDQGQLSTVKRPDGTMQVIYHGHPLYYYQGDQQPGQTTGQGNTGFGAGWYVLSPSGDKIENGGNGGNGGGGGY
jgi:predicted lipoprotein with Yx(FWY)xxD motif